MVQWNAWVAVVLVLALTEVRRARGNQSTEEVKEIAAASNLVGVGLLKTFPPGQNVFFSPASVSVALAMAYGGARQETATEMRQALGYGEMGQRSEAFHSAFRSLLKLLNGRFEGYQLKVANALLSQSKYPILPEYRQLLENNYAALLEDVDFQSQTQQAVDRVNGWVKEKTNGKIPSLLSQLSPDTRMILLNAIFFKGTWKTTFNKNSTRDRFFYNNGLNPSTVPMMKTKSSFLYASLPHLGFRAVELPYQGEEVSMLVLLPDRYDGLEAVEKTLTASVLEDVVSRLFPVRIDLEFPKFKTEDSRKLKENLISLGMRRAFDNRADFSGLSGQNDLYISQVVHKAVIEVNEEGSEAAAATAVIFLLKSSLGAIASPDFHVDRPFLFFIRHRRTNLILFAGRINTL